MRQQVGPKTWYVFPLTTEWHCLTIVVWMSLDCFRYFLDFINFTSLQDRPVFTETSFVSHISAKDQLHKLSKHVPLALHWKCIGFAWD